MSRLNYISKSPWAERALRSTGSLPPASAACTSRALTLFQRRQGKIVIIWQLEGEICDIMRLLLPARRIEVVVGGSVRASTEEAGVSVAVG